MKVMNISYGLSECAANNANTYRMTRKFLEYPKSRCQTERELFKKMKSPQ